MPRFLSWLVVPAVVLGNMAGSALAATPSIKDDAGLFSEKALQSAREEIRKIERRYRRELVIETFAGIPRGINQEYNLAVKDRFFSEWASARASKLRLRGIYILICKEPAHFQIVVNKRISNRVFSPDDRRELQRLLEQNLWSQPDQALVEAATFVETALHDHLSYNNQRPDDGAGSWLPLVYTIILVLLGAWLLGGLTRASTSPGPAKGFGSFLGTLLRSLFGAAAGMWIYESVFHGPASAADPGVDLDSTSEYGGDY